MKYRAKLSFKIKMGEELFEVLKDSLWFWKSEKGEFITVENIYHDLITIDRSDFVKYFNAEY